MKLIDWMKRERYSAYDVADMLKAAGCPVSPQSVYNWIDEQKDIEPRRATRRALYDISKKAVTF